MHAHAGIIALLPGAERGKQATPAVRSRGKRNGAVCIKTCRATALAGNGLVGIMGTGFVRRCPHRMARERVVRPFPRVGCGTTHATPVRISACARRRLLRQPLGQEVRFGSSLADAAKLTKPGCGSAGNLVFGPFMGFRQFRGKGWPFARWADPTSAGKSGLACRLWVAPVFPIRPSQRLPVRA